MVPEKFKLQVVYRDPGIVPGQILAFSPMKPLVFLSDLLPEG